MVVMDVYLHKVICTEQTARSEPKERTNEFELKENPVQYDDIDTDNTPTLDPIAEEESLEDYTKWSPCVQRKISSSSEIETQGNLLQELLRKIGGVDRKLRSSSDVSLASWSSFHSSDSFMTEDDTIEYIEMQPQGEQPASLEHVHAAELYPKKSLISDDTTLSQPYPPLPGESIEYLGRTADGVIALSNFRLFIKLRQTVINIPLALIDTIECRDIFFLYVYCKDARSHRCVFSTNEACMEWYKRLSQALNAPAQLKNVFAFAFHAWCLDDRDTLQESCLQRMHQGEHMYSFGREVERMGFDLKNEWRICYVNEEYKVCPTYPKLHIVPSKIKDDELKGVATFRSSRRFPSVVWRDQRTGAVIVRSSQPEVGWLGWRSERDEALLKQISKACVAACSSAKAMNGNSGIASDAAELEENGEDEKKMLIIDARSYAAAVANRAKGGGCECPEYYQNCEIQFMSLANIHSIRRSFQALRALCAAAPDQTSWFSTLESTKWLQHIAGLMRAALIVVHAIDKEARPVLVHCSDGWDRTPQIAALAEMMLDPYYRTIEGFQVLVEREWLDFGHKFADRCALGMYTEDTNERCPVFLQFLDCVQQLVRQFPCAFQFNEAFLVKLVQHTYSCLFGNFLCNSAQEREAENIQLETSSVWSLLRLTNSKFRNYLYTPNTNQVLRPSYHLRNLHFWSAVYLSEITPSGDSQLDDTLEGTPSEGSQDTEAPAETTVLTKTRSCDDIVAALADASSVPAPLTRRLSDPNLASDPTYLLGTDMARSAEKSTFIDSLETELKPEECKDVICETADEATETSDINCGDCEEQGVSGKLCKLLKGETVIESSTDTLTGNVEAEAQLLAQQSKKHTVQSDGEPEQEEHQEDQECESADETALEKCISISTSTTELSDSHIRGQKVKSQSKVPGTTLSLYIPETPSHVAQTSSVPNGACCSQREPASIVPSSRASNSSVESESCSPAQHHSRTPSTTSPPTPGMEKSVWPVGWRQQLDCDGLTTWVEAGQMRLVQMEAEYQARIEQLQRQLHLTRLCYYGAGRNGTHITNKEETGSQAESQESGGEQASIGGSDMSWEHVEERDASMTLWVPDHAVTHCAGCDQEFWIVRRKHHCRTCTENHSCGSALHMQLACCHSALHQAALHHRLVNMQFKPGSIVQEKLDIARNCGQVFCGDCTKFCMAIPQQQLNEPVRVCRVCFSNLQTATELACSAFTSLETDFERAASVSSSCSERTLQAVLN